MNRKGMPFLISLILTLQTIPSLASDQSARIILDSDAFTHMSLFKSRITTRYSCLGDQLLMFRTRGGDAFSASVDVGGGATGLRESYPSESWWDILFPSQKPTFIKHVSVDMTQTYLQWALENALQTDSCSYRQVQGSPTPSVCADFDLDPINDLASLPTPTPAPTPITTPRPTPWDSGTPPACYFDGLQIKGGKNIIQTSFIDFDFTQANADSGYTVEGYSVTRESAMSAGTKVSLNSGETSVSGVDVSSLCTAGTNCQIKVWCHAKNGGTTITVSKSLPSFFYNPTSNLFVTQMSILGSQASILPEVSIGAGKSTAELTLTYEHMGGPSELIFSLTPNFPAGLTPVTTCVLPCAIDISNGSSSVSDIQIPAGPPGVRRLYYWSKKAAVLSDVQSIEFQYVPHRWRNTKFYQWNDAYCGGQGPILSADSNMNRSHVGGINIELDRTQMNEKEDILVQVTFQGVTRPSFGSIASQLGVWPTGQVASHEEDLSPFTFRVMMQSSQLSFLSLIGIRQPRIWTSYENTAYPNFMREVGRVSDPYGLLRTEQFIVPTSLNDAIDRVRIERVRGSGLIYQVDVYRLGARED